MKKLLSLFTAVLLTATAFGQDIELNGTVSAQNNQIKNLADPTDDQDAVTKSYTYSKSEVDALIAEAVAGNSGTEGFFGSLTVLRGPDQSDPIAADLQNITNQTGITGAHPSTYPYEVVHTYENLSNNKFVLNFQPGNGCPPGSQCGSNYDFQTLDGPCFGIRAKVRMYDINNQLM